MRWHAYLMSLPPDEAQRLATRFTLGCGWLALAARLLANDGAIADVLAAVVKAAHALRQVRARLVVPVDVAIVWDTPAPESLGARARHWRDLILRCDFALAGRLIAELDAAVAEARAAGRLALDDGDVAAADAHLETALAILGRAAGQLAQAAIEAER
jgi:hypothetical protein